MYFSKLMPLVCAIITLSGCAFIIPPEQNAPRHNSVLGGPRRPQLNFNSGPQSSLTRAPQAANFVASAPVDPVTIASQQAPQPSITEMAYAAPTAVVPQPQFQQSTAAPVSVGALPAVDPAVKAQAERELAATAPRTIPPENQQFQVAGNYPALDSVPPRPALTGADSSQSRLSATQADLERARAQAEQSAETLARDAAAEPSLLAPLPPEQNLSPVAPLPALQPVTLPAAGGRAPIGNGAAITPTHAPEAYATPAPRITLPTGPVVTQFSMPTGPNFAPPAPLNVASLNVPERQPVRAVPAQQPEAVRAPQFIAAPTVAGTSQRQPIVLRPPVPYEAAPVVTPLVTPAPSRGGITVRPGDFDPLAGA